MLARNGAKRAYPRLIPASGKRDERAVSKVRVALSTVTYPKTVFVVRLAVPRHCQQPTLDVVTRIGSSLAI